MVRNNRKIHGWGVRTKKVCIIYKARLLIKTQIRLKQPGRYMKLYSSKSTTHYQKYEVGQHKVIEFKKDRIIYYICWPGFWRHFQQLKVWDSICPGPHEVFALEQSLVKTSTLLLKHLLGCNMNGIK